MITAALKLIFHDLNPRYPPAPSQQPLQNEMYREWPIIGGVRRGGLRISTDKCVFEHTQDIKLDDRCAHLARVWELPPIIGVADNLSADI